MNNLEGQNPENIRRVDANASQLQGLRSLHEHELAEGVPDVRGWKVVDNNGNRIGKVDDLIVDPVAQVVRYIDVDLRDSASPDDDKDYHLLIPVGTARLDDNDDVVVAQNLSMDQLDNYPRASRGGINRDYESSVRTFYDNSYRSGGQYFGESRADDVVGDRQVGSSMGNTMDDVSVSRREHESDLNEFRNSGSYGNVSNLDTSSDLDNMTTRSDLDNDNDKLDIPVTGSTSTTVTDSYTISGAERRDEVDFDKDRDFNDADITSRGSSDLMGDSYSSDRETGLDSSTALRDSDILDSPSRFENRGIIDGGNNLASGAYGTNFMDEDRDTNQNNLRSGQKDDLRNDQINDLHDERTSSYTDRGNQLSDFTENHLRQPDARSNQTEPGTFGGTDFYTDSYFDETRFFGNRFAGQRRGGLSTFPEGEGRFTLRRRNI
jgi:hypothetical protein